MATQETSNQKTRGEQKPGYRTPEITSYSASDIQAALGPAIAVY